MLTREESFEQIQFAINLLTFSYRLRVNPTCNLGVHVGNGRKLFTAATVKRIGAFLWAADPMLSRLHAPWRRIHDGSRSIRLDSNLAHGITAEEVSKKWEGGWLQEYDPLLVTDFSDTSREEMEHGGREGWVEFARWRNEVGPFMTLSEDIDDIDRNDDDNNNSNRNDSNNDNDDTGDNEGSSDDNEWTDESSDESMHNSDLVNAAPDDLSFEFDENRLPPLQYVLDVGHSALEEDQEIHVPPDPNTYHRNVGWVFWDELSDDLLVEWVYGYCQDNYGHMKPYKLSESEQITLMCRTQCAVLFDHTDLDSLTVDQEYEVLVASAPYIGTVRSAWEWKSETKRWNLVWRRVGNILEQPEVQREVKIDAPYIIQKFENLVKLTDLDNEANEQGIQYLNPEDHEESMSTNRGIEQLLEGLKDYAEPVDPDFMDNLPDPNPNAYGSRRSTVSPSSVSTQPWERDDVEFPPRGWLALMGEIRRFGRYRGQVSGNSTPASSEPETPAPKLRPHNADDLQTPYKAAINRYVRIADEEWDRIGYLPLSTNPFSGAAAPESGVDPSATTSHGMSELASSGAAAIAAELLRRTGLQLNYDFTPYTLNSLNGNQNQNRNRGIEFREAGGSLDAAWIATWVRICTGIVRWSQRASVPQYLEVLDRLMAQERRELRRMAAGRTGYDAEEQDEADRYDVCDLLEDIGLFAEAAWIRIRERESGPPR
ncbi:hypothetical protein F4781DRAFT_137236 [Annulohypoxylon bovei var. microspora]|nr:hypothetical protein F4781DRAFT_137236 [Annulohypoxylon bovei var. microspora]